MKSCRMYSRNISKYRMLKGIQLLTLSLTLILLNTAVRTSVAAPGGVNQTITYTSRISSSDYEFLPNDDYRVRLLLYDQETGGNILFEELRDGVTIYPPAVTACPAVTATNGSVDVMIGECNPLVLNTLNDTDLYLEVQMDINEDSDYEEVFSPRKNIGARVSSISTSQLTSNLEGDLGTLQMNGTGNLIFNSSNNVGIATTNPLRALSLGDSGSGIDDLASNVLSFFTNNIERVRITSTGRLGIFTNNPQVTLDINATDAVRLPIGTTVDQPVGATGMTRFNTTTNQLEVYQGTEWRGILYRDGPTFASGSFDESFNLGTGFNDQVYAIANQLDGKILVGGSFDTYQGVPLRGIVRLNSDGSRDTSFNIGSGFDTSDISDLPIIQTINVQNDGKIVVGGFFDEYRGVSANKIIRLNSDGSRDTAFNMGTGFAGYNSVRAVDIQSDGKIVVTGYFEEYQGVSANRIVRLNENGSRDTTFNVGTGFNDAVRGVTIQSDGKIIAVGQFTSYQGVSANNIIRLNANGSRDTTFNIGTAFNNNSSNRYAIIAHIQSDGKIVVGGTFNTYQGVTANKIVRLNTDGSRDTSFSIGTGFKHLGGSYWLDDFVTSIDIQTDGKIVVAGQLSLYQGVAANKIVRLNTDGSRDTSFNVGTGPNQNVWALVIQDNNRILAGGSFSQYDGQSSNYLVGIR